MRVVRHRDRDYSLQSVGSAYETGYEVGFHNKDGQRGNVKFRVLLNSAMNLVPFVSDYSGKVTVKDIEASKAIVTDELSANPSVFHIVDNGLYEMHRLRRSIDEAKRIGRVADADPLMIASEARIADLESIIRDAREWSRTPGRGTFREFMDKHEISTNRREFDAEEKVSVGDDFRVHPAMGPIDLLHAVMDANPKPASIVVVNEVSMLTRISPSVLERREFDWPRASFAEGSGRTIVYARTGDFIPTVADHLKERLSGDAVLVGWTRQTETAAFQNILDRLSATGTDPRLLLGSPEGTFSGRVSAIRNALTSAPVATLATAAHSF